MSGGSGWWLAIEPLGRREIVWSLLSSGVHDGPVAAGLSDVGAARELSATLLPDVTGDEGADAWERLWSGPLGDPTAERAAAVTLGSALLPPQLRQALLSTTGDTVTISARGWPAAVPWDALALDGSGEVRLVERATVLGGLSPGLATGLPPVQVPTGPRRPLLVVDAGPRSGGLAPLYAPARRRAWWRALAEEFAGDAAWQDVLTPTAAAPLTADALGKRLRAGDVDPFVYVGHVVAGAADAPATARLVLADDGENSQQLSAMRWLSEPERWPVPRRVALVACSSDDARLTERSGLPVALLHAGAEHVTATRWPLPADGSADTEFFSELAVAVSRAMVSPDPVRSLHAWRLKRLAAWREYGRRSDSPLLWAAVVTYHAGLQGLRQGPPDGEDRE